MLVQHVVFALSMPANRVVTCPEEQVGLVFVVLDLEVVYFAIATIGSPDQFETAQMLGDSPARKLHTHERHTCGQG